MIWFTGSFSLINSLFTVSRSACISRKACKSHHQLNTGCQDRTSSWHRGGEEGCLVRGFQLVQQEQGGNLKSLHGSIKKDNFTCFYQHQAYFNLIACLLIKLFVLLCFCSYLAGMSTGPKGKIAKYVSTTLGTKIFWSCEIHCSVGVALL